MFLYCNFFGHHFEVAKNITLHVKEYKCRNCNKELTINGNGQLIELTSEQKEINYLLYRIHNKRQAKIRRKELLAAYNLTP